MAKSGAISQQEIDELLKSLPNAEASLNSKENSTDNILKDLEKEQSFVPFGCSPVQNDTNFQDIETFQKSYTIFAKKHRRKDYNVDYFHKPCDTEMEKISILTETTKIYAVYCPECNFTSIIYKIHK